MPARAHVSWTVKQNGTKGANEPSFTTVLGEQQLAFQQEILSRNPPESKLHMKEHTTTRLTNNIRPSFVRASISINAFRMTDDTDG